MIAKRVERKKGSPYAVLVGYLLRESGQTVANEDSVEYTKITNCNLDEVQLAVKEIEATQALNTRSKIDRTYHLIVSFRSNEKPDHEQMDDIANEICQAIGLGDHQRISVAHNDTENFHLHLAINKIHPETYRAIEPYYDKYKLDTACAELELKHGLQRDNRIDREHHKEKLETGRQSGRAGDLEAHQGKDSFKRWVAERKESLSSELRQAASWGEIHAAAAKCGISIKTRGAGLVIGNLEGTAFLKASDLGRDFSKGKLEKRLGEYRPPAMQNEKNNSFYTTKKDALWEAYQKETNPIKTRRTRLLKELAEKKKSESAEQKHIYDKIKLSVFFDRSLSREQKADIATTLTITKMNQARESYNLNRQ